MANNEPYITRVQSNLKSAEGTSWSLDLDRLTLLIGPNGSLKSAVPQAVSLAVRGRYDDYLGQPKSTTSGDTIFAALDDEVVELHADAQCSNDHLYQYDRKAAAGSIKQARHTGAAVEPFCLPTMREALQAGPQKAEACLLRIIDPQQTIEDILGLVSADLHDDLRKHLNTPAPLLTTAEHYASQVRALKGRIDRTEARLTEHTAGLSPRPLDTTITQLHERIEMLRQTLASAGGTSVPKAARREVEEKLIQAQTNVTEWRQHVQKLEEGLGEAHTNYVFSENASSLLATAVEHGWEQCPVCASEVGRGHIEICYDFQTQQLEDATLKSQPEALLDARQSLAAWQDELLRVRGQLRLLDTMQGTLPEGEVDSSNIVDQLVDAIAALKDLEALRDQWTEAHRMKAEINDFAATRERAKTLSLACREAISALAKRHAPTLVAEANRYLPDRWQIDIRFEARGKHVCQVGIVRDGRFCAGLSGGQWAAVSAALAMAAADTSELCIIVPEDKGFDPQTLADIMRRFRRFKGQIIMTSCVRPKGKKPAGWTVLNIEEALVLRGAAVAEVIADPTDAPDVDIKKKARHITLLLQSWGYPQKAIDVLTPESAQDIIRNEWMPHDVEVGPLGSITFIRT